ncbi:MAG: hypothetical protein J7L94_10685 [Caldisericaceae bacterium]|nr:hypothetical protein [Caldisericaceae bacterium]
MILIEYNKLNHENKGERVKIRHSKELSLKNAGANVTNFFCGGKTSLTFLLLMFLIVKIKDKRHTMAGSYSNICLFFCLALCCHTDRNARLSSITLLRATFPVNITITCARSINPLSLPK